MHTPSSGATLANSPLLTRTNVSTAFGPGALAKPAVANGPGLALSAPEWLAIQLYVHQSLALPTTIPALQTLAGQEATDNWDDFKKLTTAYQDIHTHVTKWQNETFPESVSLASDIYAYSQQAPTYYKPIVALAQKLTIDANDAASKTKLTAILEVLKASALANSEKAGKVAKKIQDFANETLQDKIVLSGADSKGGLLAYYHKRFGTTTGTAAELQTSLLEAQQELEAANKEYSHAVTVAATTPAYYWATIFGFIAAVTVAGVYGDRARKAKNRMKEAERRINELKGRIAAITRLLAALSMTEASISNILEPLNAALPIIQRIQGVWGTIADDLAKLITTINTNIAQTMPIIMDLGVDTVLAEWQRVGEAANGYRLNAYITSTTPA